MRFLHKSLKNQEEHSGCQAGEMKSLLFFSLLCFCAALAVFGVVTSELAAIPFPASCTFPSLLQPIESRCAGMALL